MVALAYSDITTLTPNAPRGAPGCWWSTSNRFRSRSDLFQRLAEFLKEVVVVITSQDVPSSDDQGYRPVGELERGQHGKPGVVRELFGPGNRHLAQHR